jgi:hypothetical protein
LALRTARVGLFGPSLLGNVFISGATNSGKTSALRLIISQLSAPFVLDREGEFDQVAMRRLDMLRLCMRTFRHNPFDVRQLPARAREFYLARLVEAICVQGGLFDSSQGILTEIVLSLYREGVACEGDSFVLLWSDVLDAVRQRLFSRGVSHNYRGYLERINERLSLLDRVLGDVFRTRNSILPFLKGSAVVVNVEGVPDKVLSQLINVTEVYNHFLYPVLRPDRVRLLSMRILDEAHTVISADNETAGELPAAANLLADRKRGIGGLSVSHMPSAVHKLILHNSAILICMRAGSASEAEFVAKQLWGRPSARQIHALQLLPVGWAVVKCPLSVRPLVVKFHRQRNIEVDVPMLQERTARLLRATGYREEPLPSTVIEVESTTQADQPKGQVEAQAAPRASTDANAVGTSTGVTGGAVLKDAPHDLVAALRMIVEDPYLFLPKLLKHLGFGGKRANRVKEELLAHPELVRLAFVPLGRPGRPGRWARPLRALFETFGIKNVPAIAEEGAQALHTFCKEILARALPAKGFIGIVIEGCVNGKKTDVLATGLGGVLTAFEIERSDSQTHLVENVLADLRAGVRNVRVLVCSTKQRERALASLQQRLSATDLANVRVEALGDYL